MLKSCLFFAFIVLACPGSSPGIASTKSPSVFDRLLLESGGLYVYIRRLRCLKRMHHIINYLTAFKIFLRAVKRPRLSSVPGYAFFLNGKICALFLIGSKTVSVTDPITPWAHLAPIQAIQPGQAVRKRLPRRTKTLDIRAIHNRKR